MFFMISFGRSPLATPAAYLQQISTNKSHINTTKLLFVKRKNRARCAPKDALKVVNLTSHVSLRLESGQLAQRVCLPTTSVPASHKITSSDTDTGSGYWYFVSGSSP
jgi:hypothetical protein